MRVVFERVDARRYRIGVLRDGPRDVGADVDVRPAPGHADVPHDLVHFVVEEQAGLLLGIFGQVAAGGDCGGFFRAGLGARRSADELRRTRRLGRAGRADVAISERLAGAATAGRVDPQADVDPRLRRAIDARLADVLRRWWATAPGERLVLDWPRDLVIDHGRLPG